MTKLINLTRNRLNNKYMTWEKELNANIDVKFYSYACGRCMKNLYDCKCEDKKYIRAINKEIKKFTKQFIKDLIKEERKKADKWEKLNDKHWEKKLNTWGKYRVLESRFVPKGTCIMGTGEQSNAFTIGETLPKI